jgi:ketosteroid isomerase-like protein
MRKVSLWLAAAAALAALQPDHSAMAMTPTSAPAADSADRAAIEQVTANIVKGFVTRDLELIMSAYADSEDLIVIDLSPPLKYVGVTALRNLNQHWLDTFTGRVEGSYEDFRVTIVGDVAYGTNVQKWRFTRPDGTVFAFTTRLSDVYRKYAGKWRVIEEHGSIPVDLATLQPLLHEDKTVGLTSSGAHPHP